jgi:hypothetical protein
MSISLTAQIEIPMPPPPTPENNSAENNVDTHSSDEALASYAESSPVLLFKNGDTIHGELIRTLPDGNLEWKTPSSKSNIFFNLKALKSILFKRADDTQKTSGTSTITFKNNDLVSGKIIGLDDKTLYLESNSGGKLQIARDSINDISYTKSTSFHYRGPKEGDAWKKAEQSSGNFSISDDTLILPKNCAAAIELPCKSDLIKFEFEASFGIPFNMGVFTHKAAIYGGGGYMLTYNQNYVTIQKLTNQRGPRNLGNAQIENMPSKPFIKFELLVDRKNKDFTLKLENKTIQKWHDTQAGALGDFIVFQYPHGVFTTLKLRKIVFSEWDGANEEDKPEKEKGDLDIVIFENNDKTSGKVINIKDEELSFKTDYAVLKIPISRISKLIFSRSKNNPITEALTIIAIFSNNDRLSMKLSSIDNKLLKAKSPFFGEATFRIDSLSQILFTVETTAPQTNDDKNGDNDKDEDENLDDDDAPLEELARL